jgi:DNA-binding transcriptional ArsR family regulator
VTPAQIDATFMALADPTRRAILARLSKGELGVVELAEPFAMSQPAISKHLKVLERAGLVSRSRDAQRRPVTFEPARLEATMRWLDEFQRNLSARYGRLDALLDELKAAEGRKRTARRKKT